MTDELIERVARAIQHAEISDSRNWGITRAKAALAALKVGDELPHGFIQDTAAWEQGRDRAIRQAAEEMREACIEIVKFEMLAGLIKDRTLERLRALSVEPNND